MAEYIKRDGKIYLKAEVEVDVEYLEKEIAELQAKLDQIKSLK